MLLLERKKKLEVQGLVLKIVNNHCPELEALIEGPRLDRRVNLTLVVLIIPVDKRRMRLDQAFTAATKEFSATGVSLVLDEPLPLTDVIVGFRWEGEMKFVRAQVKHLSPLGGGFHQLGLQMTEVLPLGDYPQLQSVSF